MNIFGYVVMKQSEFNLVLLGSNIRANTIREQQELIRTLVRENKRLLEVEAKYKKLTDRDEKGRFVKREVEADNGGMQAGEIV
jgi:hypothetical protein